MESTIGKVVPVNELTESQEGHLEGLYDWITRQPDTEQCIADLTSRSVRDLIGHLSRQRVGTIEDSVSGKILGLLLCEASKRFMKMTNPPRANDGGAA